MRFYEIQYREKPPADAAVSDRDPAWTPYQTVSEDASYVDLELVIGRTYEIRYRLVDTEAGEEPWNYHDEARVVPETLWPPAQPRAIRIERDGCLFWDFRDEMVDLEGFEVRYSYGTHHHGNDALHIHRHLILCPPLKLCGLPRGQITFMVRALAIGGFPGPWTTEVIDRGPLDERKEDLIEETEDAGVYAGTKRDCTVVATFLRATTTTGLMWTGNRKRLWSGDDTDLLWRDRYELMEYVRQAIPPTPEGDRVNALTIDLEITNCENYRLEYRPHDAPLWSGNDTDLLWTDDTRGLWQPVLDTDLMWSRYSSEPLWSGMDERPLWAEGWRRPWPGMLDRATRQPYELFLVVPGQKSSARVSAFTWAASRDRSSSLVPGLAAAGMLPALGSDGLLNDGFLPVGTGADQVAAGDHDHWQKWDALAAPATTINLLGSASDPGRDTTDGTLLFDAASTERVAVVFQMPNDWAEGSPVYPHIHWSKTTTDVGDVVWQMASKVADFDDIMSSFSSVETAKAVVADDDTADHHAIATWSPIIMTGKKMGAVIVLRVQRTGGSGDDTYGADARLLGVSMHYKRDSSGSAQHFTK